MYYCGFTYRETYNLPVMYKHWFLRRVIKELSRKDEGGDPPPNKSTPADARALMGMSRTDAPSRIRRFS